MKTKWLVEEHTGADLGPETIKFHAVVEADTPQEAFVKASKLAPVQYIAEADEEAGHPEAEEVRFYFGPDDLTEWVEGYAWVAYDGSSVGYEVRLLSIES